jgi:DNA-binding transcriptional regulator YdaS (Cro superfamily)
MDKRTAIALLGGTVSAAASRLGITPSAISQWPDDGELPESAENRVLAHLARRHLDIDELLAEQKAA